jgi:uncharacterized protein
VQPERAKASVAVAVSGEQRADVLAEAQRVHAHVVAQAKAQVTAGAARDWTAPDVQAWEYQDWIPLAGAPGQQQQVRRFRAGGDIVVDFTDFDALGRWLAAVAELPGVEVRGVQWGLSDATQAATSREVRTEAMADAVTRAAEYAAALGLSGPIIHSIYEPGLYHHESGGGAMPRAAMMMAGDAMGGGFEMKPAVANVAAEVVAVFKTAN